MSKWRYENGMERGWNSDARHVRVGQLFAAAHFLKIRVQSRLKMSDRMLILGSYYPSELAGLSGSFTARVDGDCEFRMLGVDG